MSLPTAAKVTMQLTPLLIAASTAFCSVAGSERPSIRNDFQPIAVAPSWNCLPMNRQTSRASEHGMIATVLFLSTGGEDSGPFQLAPATPSERDITSARPAFANFVAAATFASVPPPLVA